MKLKKLSFAFVLCAAVVAPSVGLSDMGPKFIITLKGKSAKELNSAIINTTGAEPKMVRGHRVVQANATVTCVNEDVVTCSIKIENE